jgi:hypothetical protein
MSMPRLRSWSVALTAAGAVALIIEGQVRRVMAADSMTDSDPVARMT